MKISQPVKWFVGSPLGLGKQQILWIHLDDSCTIFSYSDSEGRYYGPINATDSENYNIKEFAGVPLKVFHRTISQIHFPSCVAIALFGEVAVLVESRVSNIVIKQMCYKFIFLSLELALKDIWL